jgi:hypothetical protein
MKRSPFSTWIYLLLVFASGIALGVFSDRIYTTKTVIAKSSATPRDPYEYQRKLVDEMRTRLKLDSAQVTELRTILDDTRSRMRELHEKDKPVMTAIHKEQLQRTEAMLKPEQRDEYAKMLAERAARDQKDREKKEKRDK